MTETHVLYDKNPAVLEQHLRERIGTLGPNHPSIQHAWELLKVARARTVPQKSAADLLDTAVRGYQAGAVRQASGITDGRVMELIERSLDIGDTFTARLDLEGWRGRLEASPDPSFGSRLLAAERRLTALLEFERQHGHASLLDRTSKEVHRREMAAKWAGRPSPYGRRGPSGVVP